MQEAEFGGIQEIWDFGNLGIWEFGNFGILKSGNLAILEFWNLGILEFWNFGISEFGNFGILEFRSLGNLRFFQKVLNFRKIDWADFQPDRCHCPTRHFHRPEHSGGKDKGA